jgi:biopolymer transport protein ExbD
MKNIWILLVVLLFLSCSQLANAQGATTKQPTKDSANQAISLAGKWVWKTNSATFSVTIKKEGNAYIGKYCAVAFSGAKIDCDYYDPPAFKIENVQGNEFIVNFMTYFSRTTGKVKIRVEGDIMYWKIVEEPKGEYYCPNVAVLKRTKK